jgi:hypothetical protein
MAQFLKLHLLNYNVMPNSRNSSRDRQRVAGGQEYETAYTAKKTGTTSSEVRKAVKEVGNSRKKVEGRLSGGKKK